MMKEVSQTKSLTDTNDQKTKICRVMPGHSRLYALYCVMTISALIFVIAFVATEMISGFIGEDQTISEKNGKELWRILLERSFWYDLSEVTDEPGESSSMNTTKAPNYSNGTEASHTTTVNSSVAGTDSSDNSSVSGDKIPQDIYTYDPSKVPSDMSGIVPMDLSLFQYGLDYINSSSVKSVSSEQLLGHEFGISSETVYPSKSPLVLIVHTHGTEGYTEDDVFWYDRTKEIARSEDTDKNVVSLGRIMAKVLNDRGIPTIHCETMHDLSSYTAAYANSADTIKRYLEKYPTIQLVIDLHRDAVVKNNGELVRPITQLNDGSAAQVMFVVGTGENGTPCPKWERNLALAQHLRRRLNENYCENVCRPTCLRDSSYNQQYAAMSLLIEVGAAGNYLYEAEISTALVAEALCDIILGKTT